MSVFETELHRNMRADAKRNAVMRLLLDLGVCENASVTTAALATSLLEAYEREELAKLETDPNGRPKYEQQFWLLTPEAQAVLDEEKKR